MLTLTRRAYEDIYLYHNGDLIAVVTVTDIQRGKVRIGIQSDRDIIILRGELAPDATRAK